MNKPSVILYYVHDPMCSWCWGFRPVWEAVQQALSGNVSIQYVLGGLAPDTQQAMPETMQRTIQETWRRIQQEIPGTVFNYDFWTDCQPRRSTYAACRAVIAAGFQGEHYEQMMLLAIQQAYYLQAKNPSDEKQLIQLSADIGLDVKQFEDELYSRSCEKALNSELQFASRLGVSSFPSLVLSRNEANTLININYTSSDLIVSEVLECLANKAEM